METLWKIRYPFEGNYHITFPYGATSTNEHISHKLSQMRLKGHSGLDFGLPVGTHVLAVYDGTVTQAGEQGSYGKTVVIKHVWGESLYAHLSDIRVSLGQQIRESDVIGASGDTGYTFGPHLHFAIKLNGADENNGYHGFVDPEPYFSRPPTSDPLAAANARNIAVTFECFIKKNDRYLMLLRSKDKKIMPGVMMASGGKREFNEGLFTATRREVAEETGMEIKNLRIRATGNAYVKSLGQEFFFHFVFADWKNGELQSHTADGEFMWLTPEEIMGREDVLAEIKELGMELFDTEARDVLSFTAVYDHGNNLTSFHRENPE